MIIAIILFFVFSSELQQRELEAISHVRDSVQMVENAILERDQVMERSLALSTSSRPLDKRAGGGGLVSRGRAPGPLPVFTTAVCHL